ncbi:hypothetical protein A3D72_00705 [Candidatus Uhrbacteria bacterium RIFCSPHIGHO2_02_FULL_57_19]|uniref:Single-stranded DNA-binding protein n=1 Tax=Candidatus Uhrbacteria bacterium RIFCSPHIGHO2_02_FULL_57_19 TaxID=1802391 RepID=A0A1F7U522_9BACT|nr:MAG: hypothetical protein A3D72_00705 [Candidatus Uhrbacteria bacterium RIFCSPHIGHO2_02_FULL_57_19]
MNLNRAMIIGNMTRDPELRTTPNGHSVVSFGVATNRRWNDQASGQKKEEVEFHNIVAWGKLAEICSQYLARGRKVYVEGRLHTRDWEGQDGVKRNRTEIIAENMIILDRAPAGAGFGAGVGVETGAQAFAPQMSVATAPASSASAPLPTVSADEEIKVEDIPF